MVKYLGETIQDIEQTEFRNYTPNDWVMYFIESYGQIDGSHHKQWVLDQIARILNGTKVIVTLAKWDDGNEKYRITLDEPSAEYNSWVKKMLGNETDGEYEYDYDEGIAP